MSFEKWTIEELFARCTDYDDGSLSMDKEEFAALRRMLQGTNGKSPVVPDGWIAVSDRLPESKPGSYEYIVFETLNNRAHHDYWNVPDRGDDAFTPFWNHYGKYVTHWMPLPAAPQQEVTLALAKGMKRYGDAMQELAKKEVK